MNLYRFMSVGYDLLDKMWFSDKGINPRDEIRKIISNEEYTVLDMCCGTFSNGMQIAKNNPNNRVLGLDRSESMLREAKKKIRKEKLRNAKLVCKDATQTGLESNTFDYIVIGLVLHECSAELWKGILEEAHRLLKKNGKLVVLEWNKQIRLSRKIKFAPLYIAEIFANPKYFKRFYYSDKHKFFRNYGFEMIEKHECNYSVVLEMNRKQGENMN